MCLEREGQKSMGFHKFKGRMFRGRAHVFIVEKNNIVVILMSFLGKIQK